MTKKLFLFITGIVIGGNLPAQENLFDLHETPYSCRGSWMALSAYREEGREKLYLRDVCGRRLWQNNRVFLLEPLLSDHVVSGMVFYTEAARIVAENSSGRMEFTFESPDVLRIRGKNNGMRLTLTAPYDASSLVIPVARGQWRLQMGGFPHFVFTALRGESQLVKGSRLTVNMVNEKYQRKEIEMVIEIFPDSTGLFEAAIENYYAGWAPQPAKYHLPFDDCVKKLSDDFETWCRHTPAPLKGYEKTWRLANYINWSCIVNPRGLIDRPMMLSSKNNMHALWTWDTWFFCIATSYSMPEYAWNACLFHARHQDPVTGLIPNLVTDVNYMWGFAYPCIWGWAIRKMIEHHPPIGTPENLKKIYDPLCKATDFWFLFQDDDGDGLPQYNHTNDSGMDNSTAGDVGMSIEAPDLAAYLVVQMDVLSEIALRLKRTKEAKVWKQRADTLLNKMIRELWTGTQFVARRTDDNQYNGQSRSVLLYMPLILGKRLPEEIRNTMINDLKHNGMFTQVGICSEHPESPLYAEDSYWRGPVWSPPTYLIASGIRECGDTAFAREIARRYCDNCVKNGFGENFEPFTGKSLKDRSLPWTAAIFIILMEDFLKH